MDVRENKRDESERLATCFLPAESLPPLIPVLLLAQFAATAFGVRTLVRGEARARSSQ